MSCECRKNNFLLISCIMAIIQRVKTRDQKCQVLPATDDRRLSEFAMTRICVYFMRYSKMWNLAMAHVAAEVPWMVLEKYKRVSMQRT